MDELIYYVVFFFFYKMFFTKRLQISLYAYTEWFMDD